MKRLLTYGISIFGIFIILPLVLIFRYTPIFYTDHSYNGIKPVYVNHVPDGYLRYKEVNERYGDIITTGFFDSQIYFLDIDRRNIKQTSFSDPNFVVQHRNHLYVNEEQIKALLPLAEDAAKAHRKIYSIGETVEVYSRNTSLPITFEVKDVLYTNILKGVAINNYEWVCLIEIAVGGNDGDVRSNLEFFERLELESGDIYTDFFEVGENSVAIKLPLDVNAEYLFVKSPFYHNNIRTIGIN